MKCDYRAKDCDDCGLCKEMARDIEATQRLIRKVVALRTGLFNAGKLTDKTSDALILLGKHLAISCELPCPVYELQTNQERESGNCVYHKDGKGMAGFILQRSNPSNPSGNEKMDSYFSVFNLHVNQADKKAKKDFLKKYGEHGWETVMAPIIKAGVMCIFKQQPTDMTQYYVDRITFYVNEGR